MEREQIAKLAETIRENLTARLNTKQPHPHHFRMHPATETALQAYYQIPPVESTVLRGLKHLPTIATLFGVEVWTDRDCPPDVIEIVDRLT